LYGRPYQTPLIPRDVRIAGETDLKMYLISLGKTLEALRKYVVLTRSLASDTPVHRYPPGDFMCIRTWNSEPLQEKWKGPFQALFNLHCYQSRRSGSVDTLHSSDKRPLHGESSLEMQRLQNLS